MRRRGRSKNMFNGVSIFYLKFTISTASMDLYKKKLFKDTSVTSKYAKHASFLQKTHYWKSFLNFSLNC